MNALITKKLSSSTLDLMKSWGWSYDVIEALEIIPVVSASVPESSDAWIVSSRNSWKMIQKFIGKAPSKIFCVGNWWQERLEEITSADVKCFESMKLLADTLQQFNFQSVVYFCGNHHRSDLEDGLKYTSIKIKEVVTYESNLTNPFLRKNYDVVFVFSPRSVESITKHNTFSVNTVFACIGPTTEAAVSICGISNIFCASYPDSKILLTEFHDKSITLNQNSN